MMPGRRYPDLIDSITETVNGLKRFLVNASREMAPLTDTLQLALDNYLREGVMNSSNPIVFSSIGGIVSSAIRQMKSIDSETLLKMAEALESSVEEIIQESIQASRKWCSSSLSGAGSILLIMPGRLAVECINSAEDLHVYTIKHLYTAYKRPKIKHRVKEVLPSNISSLQGEINGVVLEVAGIVKDRGLAPPASLGSIGFTKATSNPRVIGLTMGLALRQVGTLDASSIRLYTETPQVWGEFIRVMEQEILPVRLLDTVVVDGDAIEQKGARLAITLRRIASTASKRVVMQIVQAVKGAGRSNEG